MRLRLYAAVAALAASTGAAAAAAYPVKPVRLVTTFAPGGGADVVARAIGSKLQESWGHALVIDNRAGAGGIVGTEIVARAAPDGYTLLMGSAAGLFLNGLLGVRLPYDAFRDLAPISLLVINPQLLTATASIQVSSVKELIGHLKARPGAVNYASVGQGSTSHLGMELFKSMTGTNAVHVAYKGSAPALNALIAGEVQVMFSNMPGVLPHARAGRVKALGVGGTRRATAAPDLPTIAESGVPGFQNVAWFGLFAPARVPKDVVAIVNAAIVSALADPAVVQRLIAGGAEPAAGTPEALRAYMGQEFERWKGVVQAAKLQAQ
jgi:tripartite-type tricarboxylate transporter receptor subunit TctC